MASLNEDVLNSAKCTVGVDGLVQKKSVKYADKFKDIHCVQMVVSLVKALLKWVFFRVATRNFKIIYICISHCISLDTAVFEP